MLLRPGLVSVSFRSLSPRQIIDACRQNHLEALEWGSDVHVPHGDATTAREVGKMTREAGLEVATYGSYFRCDQSELFEPILETAVELGAPSIRVWASQKSPHAATPADWEKTIEELKTICDLAARENIVIATEYHQGTLTETRESGAKLHQLASHPNLKTLWQPLRRANGFEPRIEENLDDLRAVKPILNNVHVYDWAQDENGQWLRLSLENSVQWPLYRDELQTLNESRWLLLEFVPDDAIENLPREAAALRRLLHREI